MDRFEEQWANENAALANASAAVDAAWSEESNAAQRLRDAQTATSVAAHDLSIRQLERIRAQKELLDARKRVEHLMAAKGVKSRDGAAEPHARRRFWLVAPVLVVFLASVFVAWQWTATSVRVCSTSMTDGIARQLVRAYHQFPYHYTLAPADDRPCDVRFNATRSGDPSSVFARDGLVAIVNKSNHIRKLTTWQLRDIFDGHIRNWSKLGATPAHIVAVMPPDGSDEAREAQAFLHRPLGPAVWRSTTADIVKYVTSTRGKHAIGLVPFSYALSAKIVPIAGSPSPSAFSIAHQRYPLWVGLMAASDYLHPKAGASGLIAFARSHDAIVIPSVGARRAP